ncbi:MAG: hypothetical protein NTX25_02310 [Proteobacteria bacterium]|nr:hypothetical protein [Pseudomonadota bacterium]
MRILKSLFIFATCLNFLACGSAVTGNRNSELSDSQISVVSTRKVNLRSAANNKFVCDELLNVFGNIYANRDSAQGWETFDMIALSDGQIVLYSHASPNYLSSGNKIFDNPERGTPVYREERYESSILGKSGSFSQASRLWRIENEDGTVSFWSPTYSKYLSVELRENGRLSATADAISVTEKFFETAAR